LSRTLLPCFKNYPDTKTTFEGALSWSKAITKPRNTKIYQLTRGHYALTSWPKDRRKKSLTKSEKEVKELRASSLFKKAEILEKADLSGAGWKPMIRHDRAGIDNFRALARRDPPFLPKSQPFKET